MSKKDQMVKIEYEELTQWHKLLVGSCQQLMQINTPVGQAHVISRPVNGVARVAEAIQLVIHNGDGEERVPQAEQAQQQESAKS